MEAVTIIGAGPAGIATALQLRHYGIPFVLLEKDVIGGLLRNANLVENYPGFPKGISGLELVSLFEQQLAERKIKVIFETVTKLDIETVGFRVNTTKRTFHSPIVVIASGTKPKEFTDFEISPEIRDNIFYEVFPLLGERGKKIAIVGAGDAAFDYALNLAKNNQVVILNREESVRSLPLLWERATLSPHITYHRKTRISQIGKNSTGQLSLECVTPEGNTRLHADYVVFAIGREPQLDFLSERLREKVMELVNQEALFMVGDVKNGSFRQTGIATGEGIRAAMRIQRKLEGKCL